MSNPSTKRFVVLVTLIIVVLMIDEYFNVEVLNLTKNSSVYRTNVTKLHLLHVLSPFVAPSVPTEFYPLDINQWVAMESIRRALLTIHLSPEIFQVDLICAVFQSDLEALSKANLPCHRFVVLKRSTRTQYPQLKIDMDLPFVADMIEAATTKFKDPNSSFHVMITNADIGLSKYFYKTLHSLLQKVDAVSINRVTIPMENITATRNATDILENQIDTLISQGSKHPGFDLFCINSSVLTRVSFGDFFLGRPPW